MKIIPTLEARELIDKVQIDSAAISVAHTNWNLRYVMTTTDERALDRAADILRGRMEQIFQPLYDNLRLYRTIQSEELQKRGEKSGQQGESK